jgi:hypothetical protein
MAARPAALSTGRNRLALIICLSSFAPHIIVDAPSLQLHLVPERFISTIRQTMLSPPNQLSIIQRRRFFHLFEEDGSFTRSLNSGEMACPADRNVKDQEDLGKMAVKGPL